MSLLLIRNGITMLKLVFWNYFPMFNIQLHEFYNSFFIQEERVEWLFVYNKRIIL